MAITKVTSGGIADGTLSVEDIADDAVTAAKLANSINTDIATGVTGNTTANAALPKAGGTMTGAIAGFTSTGIDDNATSTAVTIDASENVGIGITPTHKLHVSGSTSRFHRSHSTTTAALAVLDIHAESTGAMADGFGTQIRFVSEDTAGVENIAATLNVRRDGADTAAAFVFNAGASETIRMPSSGGITFNGDTAAANALDDYEEGSWTPTLTCGSGTASINTLYNTIAYTKIGRLCYVIGRVHVQSVSSPSGTLRMTLPFTAASLSEESDYASFILHLQQATGSTTSGGTMLATVFGGQSSAKLLDTDGIDIKDDLAAHLKNDCYIQISGAYQV